MSLPGPSILCQLAASFAESVCPEASQASLEAVSSAISAFIDKSIDRDECRARIVAAIGRDEPLVRIEEILTLPDEPLPFTGDPESDGDSASAARRRTRTWTSAEDQRLLGGVIRFGLDNWQAVARYLGNGRNRAQCSQRWARGLNPRISKKAWTPEEDRELERLVRQYGEKSWAKIASIMGNRSDVQCRYHYRQILSGDDGGGVGLERKSKVSMTQHDFRLEGTMSPPVSPGVDLNEGYLSLPQGRLFASTPMMVGVGQPGLLIPLAPITDRRRIHNATPEPPAVIDPIKARFGVCGTDPQTMDSFLRQFE